MRRVRGFTLLELMVVVAIIAILAGLAISSYSKQMRKGRRAEAKAAIAKVVLREEKWRSDNPMYIGTDSSSADLTAAGISNIANIGNNDWYTIAITTVKSGTDYTVTAAPKGDQVNDSCGTLSYAVTGATTTKTPAECW